MDYQQDATFFIYRKRNFLYLRTTLCARNVIVPHVIQEECILYEEEYSRSGRPGNTTTAEAIRLLHIKFGGTTVNRLLLILDYSDELLHKVIAYWKIMMC